MWWKIKKFFSHHFSHEELREKARTLNAYCFVEITVIGFSLFMVYDLLVWYKGIMTVENFNGTAFWGAIMGLGTAVFGSLKYINKSLEEGRKE